MVITPNFARDNRDHAVAGVIDGNVITPHRARKSLVAREDDSHLDDAPSVGSETPSFALPESMWQGGNAARVRLTLVVTCKNKRYMLKSLDESSSGQN